ncbi:glycosyl transferase family 2 [Nitrosococcus halophilus Nc 4]|uniref:Glycosyl transferase family 2 n=1 Tax=Nitrosococcus halophilus (strain Nc4) TaxID=472759 RepID=D5C2L6_NITHN|nr:glycosyltransferase family 2 protein [Nitrosococcus halophilus]ADE16691.1 glycosyl transferase family 2 [Nitrosococcus halophilus Nc 4]
MLAMKALDSGFSVRRRMPALEKTAPSVCAVVLNWNRPDHTLECLDSLLPLIQKRQLALVVCDNASSDDSIDRIRAWAGRHFHLQTDSLARLLGDSEPSSEWDFLLVQTGANRGYSGGNNVGIRCALGREQCEFVWILNNDVLVHPHALDALLACAQQNSHVGVFGSTIVDYYRRDRVQMAGGCRYQPLTTLMNPVGGGRSLNEVLAGEADVPLDYIGGAALFCRAEMLRKVGLFDERFFLYYEETDLARRARARGYALRWCQQSLVYHKGGVSTGGRSSVNRKESWRSNYYENLSTLLYTRKHHPKLLPMAATLRFLGKSLVYLLRRRLRLFSALMTAYRDALTGRQTVVPTTLPEPTLLASGSVLRRLPGRKRVEPMDGACYSVPRPEERGRFRVAKRLLENLHR